MQFPESWLREFCNPPLNAEALADTLTMGGFEVEEVQTAAPPFSNVVVGEIKVADAHPDADRLRVCSVDVGAAQALQIVCGAPNARVGIKVPCALVGAVLPPDADGKSFSIKQTRLRGVESHGMLCSGRELGLSQDHAGLLELPADAPVGQDVRTLMDLDEAILTVKLTPNLGHALSVYGLARELSALTGAPLQTPALAPVAVDITDVLPVKISAADLCGRFSGRIIRHVNTQARTPSWMVDRLARCGQRSVNALVDISNYVLFEYGRPSHIFDLDKLDGGLDVRWGRKGETIKLLNGNTITVDDEVGVIADDRELESLAGIMGGDATAVSDDTQNIYVEAAFWWPDAVAGRSKRFNFTTEAGHRFERGVDPALTVEHIERITALILDICGTPQTVCGPVDDQQPNMPTHAPVTLRVARAAKVIGVDLTTAQCVDVFKRLQFDFSEKDDVIEVRPPMHRFDLVIEADLIEEIARVIGYQHLPDSPPLAPIVPQVRSETRRSAFDVRHAMASLGYLETINFSFVEDAWERDLAGNDTPIRLVNPIASQMNVMRSSLLGSLLAVVKYNVDRRASRLRVFELGRVFARDANIATTDHSVQGVNQPLHLAGAMYGPVDRQGWQGREKFADFYDIKGDVEALMGTPSVRFMAAEHPAFHPGRSAAVQINDRTVGHVGELHPRWRQAWDMPQAPVMFELELEAVLQHTLPKAGAVARQLPVERDLAVVVAESVTHDQLINAALSAPTGGLLQDVTLFDIFRPKTPSADVAANEKSMALHLALRAPDDERLVDESIDKAVQAVLATLQKRLNARLRS